MPVSSSLRERARWTRIAAQLDRELGPVTFQPVPMRDGESVAEWRARNIAAIEADLAERHYVRQDQARRGLPFILCQAHLAQVAAEDQAVYARCSAIACGTSGRDCERCSLDEGE